MIEIKNFKFEDLKEGMLVRLKTKEQMMAKQSYIGKTLNELELFLGTLQIVKEIIHEEKSFTLENVTDCNNEYHWRFKEDFIESIFVMKDKQNENITELPFKIGDTIKGKQTNLYIITDDCIKEAKVVSLNIEQGYMKIKILEHINKYYVGEIFTVCNSKAYFELVKEDAENIIDEKQLDIIGHLTPEEFKGFLKGNIIEYTLKVNKNPEESRKIVEYARRLDNFIRTGNYSFPISCKKEV